jgi:large subunit ribosomal protein L18
MKAKEKVNKRKQRHIRVRAKVKGTKDCPRLSVFRSNKYMVLQLVDDATNKSIVQITDSKLVKGKMTKIERSHALGKKFAELLKKKKIKKIVFDRSGYKYHGRVAAAAKGIREGGIEF